MKKFSSITRVNSRRTSRNNVLLRILLFAVVMVALVLIVPRLFSSAVSVIVSPIASVKTWFVESSDSLPLYFRERSELVAEISDLRSQVSGASGDHLTISRLVEENSLLRSLLGYEGEERIVAGVIGRPGSLPYDALMLDRGTESGIVDGAPVFIGNNAVIGIVKRALPNSSVVELITTSGFKATVYVLGPNIYTTAEGMGGGQLRVGVPQGITLSVGDLVVLPSVRSGVYGEISVVQSEATRPEQYGFVSPEIPLASLRLVSVGKLPLETITFEDAQAILKENKTDILRVAVPDNILVDIDTATTSATTSEPTTEEEDEL